MLWFFVFVDFTPCGDWERGWAALLSVCDYVVLACVCVLRMTVCYACVCVCAALLGRSAKLFIMHSNAWTLIYAATFGAPGYSPAPFP